MMKKESSKPKRATGLPKKAKKKPTKSVDSYKNISAPDIKKLIHELQVHQVELESQNEQLRQAQIEATEAQEKYADLFDFAPVGYFTIDKKGYIIDANITGASLLGFDRLSLIKQPFHRFVIPSQQSIFLSHLRDAIGTRSKQTCQLKLTRKDGSLFDALIETVIVTDRKGRKIDHYMSCVTDITSIAETEEALRESERNLAEADREKSDILGSISDCFYALDKDLRFIFVNKAAEKMWNLSQADLIGHKIEDVFVGLIDTSLSKFRQVLEEQIPQHYEIYSKVIQRWGEMRVYPTRNGLSIYFQDITERKRAEEALQRSEERFRQLADSTFEGILIHDKGVILDVNQALTRLTGYHYEEAIGKSALTFIAPESQKEVLHRLQNPSVATFEISLMKKDGTTCLMEAAGKDITYGGKVVRVVALRDITEREQADEALRKSEERFRQLAHATFEGILIHDGSSILDANQALTQLIGYNYLELIGKNVFTIVAPESREVVSQKMKRPSVAPYEISLIKKSGTTCLVEVTARAITYEGKTARVVAVRDITERKRAEEELIRRHALLEEANKDLESFSYSVSHDLRAPLRAIDGYARMLLKKHGHEFDEDSLRKFNVIRSSTHMMGELIDDLLTLSRLGRKQLSMATIDMGALIQDVWKELQADTPGRNINLTIKSMPSGYGDRTLIKQVYINLLSNAVKFTKLRDPALIEVGGYIEANDDVYYVKDNGVGFNMTYYDKLFGVFQRLHRADEFEGTGIGLATVQRIIRRHGGKVWAEGREGEGATFYFSLPPPEIH